MNFVKNNICHASSQKTTTLVLCQALRKISAQKGKKQVRYFCLDFPQFLLFTYSANPFRTVK